MRTYPQYAAARFQCGRLSIVLATCCAKSRNIQHIGASIAITMIPSNTCRIPEMPPMMLNPRARFQNPNKMQTKKNQSAMDNEDFIVSIHIAFFELSSLTECANNSKPACTIPQIPWCIILWCISWSRYKASQFLCK